MSVFRSSKQGAHESVAQTIDGLLPPPPTAPPLSEASRIAAPYAVVMPLRETPYHMVVMATSEATQLGKILLLMDASYSIDSQDIVYGRPLRVVQMEALMKLRDHLQLPATEGGLGVSREDLRLCSFADDCRHHDVGNVSDTELKGRGQTKPSRAIRDVDEFDTVIGFTDGALNESAEDFARIANRLAGKRIVWLGFGEMFRGHNERHRESRMEAMLQYNARSGHSMSAVIPCGDGNLDDIAESVASIGTCMIHQPGSARRPCLLLENGVHMDVPEGVQVALVHESDLNVRGLRSRDRHSLQAHTIQVGARRLPLVLLSEMLGAEAEPDWVGVAQGLGRGVDVEPCPLLVEAYSRLRECQGLVAKYAAVLSERYERLYSEEELAGVASRVLTPIAEQIRMARWRLNANEGRRMLARVAQKSLAALKKMRQIRASWTNAAQAMAGSSARPDFTMQELGTRGILSVAGHPLEVSVSAFEEAAEHGDGEEAGWRRILEMTSEDITSMSDEEMDRMRVEFMPTLLLVTGLVRNRLAGAGEEEGQPRGEVDPRNGLRWRDEVCREGSVMVVDMRCLLDLCAHVGIDTKAPFGEMLTALSSGGELRRTADWPESMANLGRYLEGARLTYGGGTDTLMILPINSGEASACRRYIQFQCGLPQQIYSTALIGEVMPSNASWASYPSLVPLLARGSTEHLRSWCRTVAASAVAWGRQATVAASLVELSVGHMLLDDTYTRPMRAVLTQALWPLLRASDEAAKGAFPVDCSLLPESSRPGGPLTHATLDRRELWLHAPNLFAVLFDVLRDHPPEAAWRHVLDLCGGKGVDAAQGAVALLLTLAMTLQPTEDNRGVRETARGCLDLLEVHMFIPKALDAIGNDGISVVCPQRELAAFAVPREELSAPAPSSALAMLMSEEQLAGVGDLVAGGETPLPCIDADLIASLLLSNQELFDKIRSTQLAMGKPERVAQCLAGDVAKTLERRRWEVALARHLFAADEDRGAIDWADAESRFNGQMHLTVSRQIPYLRCLLDAQFGLPERRRRLLSAAVTTAATAQLRRIYFAPSSGAVAVLRSLLRLPRTEQVSRAWVESAVQAVVGAGATAGGLADALRAVRSMTSPEEELESIHPDDAEGYAKARGVLQGVSRKHNEWVAQLSALFVTEVTRSLSMLHGAVEDQFGVRVVKDPSVIQHRMVQSLLNRGCTPLSTKERERGIAATETPETRLATIVRACDGDDVRDSRLFSSAPPIDDDHVLVKTVKAVKLQEEVAPPSDVLVAQMSLLRYRLGCLCGSQEKIEGAPVVTLLARASLGDAGAYQLLVRDTSTLKDGTLLRDVLDLRSATIASAVFDCALGDGGPPHPSLQTLRAPPQQGAPPLTRDEVRRACTRLRLALLCPSLSMAANYAKGETPLGKGSWDVRVAATLCELDIGDQPLYLGGGAVNPQCVRLMKDRFFDADAAIRGAASPPLPLTPQQLKTRGRLMEVFEAESVCPGSRTAQTAAATALLRMLAR